MSLEAMIWALKRAPVDESSYAFVLTGLADHAGPDGRNAFPSTGRLCEYTRLSERTVQECLDVLEWAEIIRPSDPAIVAAHIKRADQRPQGWDLDMSLDKDNPEHLARFHAALARLKAKRKERRERLASRRSGAAAAAGPDGAGEKVKTGQRSDQREVNGVRPSHPVEPVDNSAEESGEIGHGVRPSHPVETITGCDRRGNGVRPSRERGATVAPEPYIEPSLEPSQGLRTPVTAVGGPTVDNARGPSAPAAQPRIPIKAQTLLAELRRYRGAPGWARQRHLVPMAAQALDRFGRDAIVRYALMVAAEERFAEHQHIPEFREALRRLGRDVQLGDACAEDGLDPAACPCDAYVFPPPDRPWTQDDQAEWERVLERLGVTDEDLDAAAEG